MHRKFFLLLLCCFSLPMSAVAAEFWVEPSPYLRLLRLRPPEITGQVTLSTTQVLQSEIVVFDIEPGMPEYAELSTEFPRGYLDGAQSFTQRVNLITDGKPQTIWSFKIIGPRSRSALGPDFELMDGWLDGKVCVLVIQHSIEAKMLVLVKEPDGRWKVSDSKQLLAGLSKPCSIRKTSPPVIVQTEGVDGVATPVDRFYLIGHKLVSPPQTHPLPDQWEALW
jgi:hypothetical protein